MPTTSSGQELISELQGIKSMINSLRVDLADAKRNAAAALNKANSVEKVANNANRKAELAENKAQRAGQEASEAKGTANKADNNASNANRRANNAEVEARTAAGRDYYAPITELIIPVVFDKPIILVNLSTSIPDGSKWNFAGHFNRLVSTAFGDCEVERRSLFLGKRNLIFFSQVDADYKLSYAAPKWFRDLSLTIYQYDGPITSDLENQLKTIETKIDALL